MGYQAIDQIEDPRNYDRITSNDEILKALLPAPKFESRDEIKSWVYSKLHRRGINLVIERSDATKVVFKCKNFHKKTPHTCAAVTPTASKPQATNNKKKASSSKAKNQKSTSFLEDGCPFRLRVSFSLKTKTWAFIIAKTDHNPLLCCNFGDPVLQSQMNLVVSPSSAMNTPGVHGTKRSYSLTNSYTPASTVSPAFSMGSSSSPATSMISPASEASGMFYNTMNHSKKQKLSTSRLDHLEFPLLDEEDPFHDNLSIDELDDFQIAIKGERDILGPFSLEDSQSENEFSHLKQEIEETDSLEDIIQDALTIAQRYEETTSPKSMLQHQNYQNILNNKLPDHILLDSIPEQHSDFDAYFLDNETKIFNESVTIKNIFKKYEDEEDLAYNIPQALENSLPTDPSDLFNLDSGLEELPGNECEDPLMYMLNTGSITNSNPNYTLEELENMDKAMGFGTNNAMAILQNL